jgi:hypothetical protein
MAKTEKAMQKEDLDGMGCGMPNCGHDHSTLYFHPRCHLQGGTLVRYEKKEGLLIIDCAVCEREVARIKI